MPDTLTNASSFELFGEPTYRAYRLSGTGRIEGVEVIEARTDDEAKRLAAQLADTHAVDLWERARFLGSYPASVANGPGAKAR